MYFTVSGETSTHITSSQQRKCLILHDSVFSFIWRPFNFILADPWISGFKCRKHPRQWNICTSTVITNSPFNRYYVAGLISFHLLFTFSPDMKKFCYKFLFPPKVFVIRCHCNYILFFTTLNHNLNQSGLHAYLWIWKKKKKNQIAHSFTIYSISTGSVLSCYFQGLYKDHISFIPRFFNFLIWVVLVSTWCTSPS